jgi:hypothetical protein
MYTPSLSTDSKAFLNELASANGLTLDEAYNKVYHDLSKLDILPTYDNIENVWELCYDSDATGEYYESREASKEDAVINLYRKLTHT